MRHQETERPNLVDAMLRQEMFDQFKQGKPFYYRTDDKDDWRVITEIRPPKIQEHEDSNDIIIVDSDGKRGVVDYKDFLDLQQEATEENAAGFVELRQQQKEEIDTSDRSYENKMKIFAVRFRPRIGEHFARTLLAIERASATPYQSLLEQLAGWARNEGTEYANKWYPGWKSADFIEMIKILEDNEAVVKAEVEQKLSELGVDVEEQKRKIAEAKRAEKILHEAKTNLFNTYGIGVVERQGR